MLAATNKIKILIVEDDIPVAMMMVFLLTRAGCKTEVAATGKKAMQMAEEGNFDLITLDVDLPDGSGFNLCSRLKEHPRLRDTPVVFVSARCLIEDQQHGLEAGAVDYITKPFGIKFAPLLLSHIKSTSNGFDDRAEPSMSITKNAESDREKALHDIEDKVL